MGLSGQAKTYYFSVSVSCDWDSVLFSHEFLIVPESPSPLLGRDILSKVHASVFMNMEPSLSLPLVEQNVNPRVWADGKSVGQAQNAIPVVVKLKHPHLFPHKKQYPLKPEVKEGLKPIKILQARLQQYVNREIPDVQAGFRKGRGTRD